MLFPALGHRHLIQCRSPLHSQTPVVKATALRPSCRLQPSAAALIEGPSVETAEPVADVQQQQQQVNHAGAEPAGQPSTHDASSPSGDEATCTSSSTSASGTSEDLDALLETIKQEVSRRKNFAIISHPDAG